MLRRWIQGHEPADHPEDAKQQRLAAQRGECSPVIHREAAQDEAEGHGHAAREQKEGLHDAADRLRGCGPLDTGDKGDAQDGRQEPDEPIDPDGQRQIRPQ